MNAARPTLPDLGWTPFFAAQLSPEEVDRLLPARVFEVQRTHITLMAAEGELSLPLGGRWFQLDPEERPTVGDWVLVSPERDAVVRLLDRNSLLKRLSPGRTGAVQLIAANVDTLFLVSSCNQDFNPRRLERYLALAYEAGIEPVVVLTKADLCGAVEAYVDEARKLGRGLEVVALDVRDRQALAPLSPWFAAGHTVALLGSSGVGKSTLVNALCDELVQRTAEIREDDGKGRHTTTHRSLHPLPGGGLILDSPGMRELGMAEAERGVRQMFDDVEALAHRCRFADCRHDTEPGCAVKAAIEAGGLTAERLESYRKLSREEALNAETIAERHARHRATDKLHRRVQEASPKRKR
ncbi:MAG: ribosome small subunit-dependent GTPase A [Pseudomonadales bacterium]|nr:ribosome small subunit-dependent GTPase A [Pseudomonadales bacterium]NIX07255.1 ribosome small subunit-dependent GTPase A [Pseudomonadales bacterium]